MIVAMTVMMMMVVMTNVSIQLCARHCSVNLQSS